MAARNNKGFTVIELLVIIIILGIILSISLPISINLVSWKSTLYLPRTYHQNIKDIVVRPVNFNGFKKNRGSIFNKESRIAILSFKQPDQTQAGALISDMFTALLQKEGYQVLERENIDKVLREQEIIESRKTSLTDLEIADRLGNLISADYMVFGAVTLYQVKPQSVLLPVRIRDEDRDEYEKDYLKYKERYMNRTRFMFWLSEEEKSKQFRRKIQPLSLQELDRQYGERTKKESHIIASIGVSAKVVDVKSGEIVWLGQGETNDLNVVDATRRILEDFLYSIQHN